jgi:hypothetical protein
MKDMNNIAARLAARDLAACLALSNERKREDAARRARAQANPELCAWLLADARRRGLAGIDWPAYFRDAHMC